MKYYVHIARGIPAAGKTHTLRNQGDVLISKDEIRRAMYPNARYIESDLFLVEDLRDISVQQHLEKDFFVAVDETFIEKDDVERFIATLPEQTQIVVHDLTVVPFQLCVLRDLTRQRSLGFDVLMDARERLLKQPKIDWPDNVRFQFPNHYDLNQELGRRLMNIRKAG